MTLELCNEIDSTTKEVREGNEQGIESRVVYVSILDENN